MSARNQIVEKYLSDGIGSVENRRKEYIKNAKILREKLPELPKPTTISSSILSGLWLTYPYNRDLRESIRKIFVDAGWSLVFEVSESDVVGGGNDPRFSFSSPGQYYSEKVSVVCEFSTFVEGATCKRVSLGKVQKEVEVFDYVCEDNQESE